MEPTLFKLFFVNKRLSNRFRGESSSFAKSVRLLFDFLLFLFFLSVSISFLPAALLMSLIRSRSNQGATGSRVLSLVLSDSFTISPISSRATILPCNGHLNLSILGHNFPFFKGARHFHLTGSNLPTNVVLTCGALSLQSLKKKNSNSN